VDKQQQLESMRVELKAANSKEIPGSSSSQSNQRLESSSHVCKVSSQQLAKM